jgi:SAM-dependent methyltransferase
MKISENFDVWDNIFPKFGKKLIGFNKIFDAVTEHCGDIAGTKWLDVGCSVGYLSFRLADMGATVTALDVHKGKLKKAMGVAEQFYALDNPTFLNQDVLKYLETMDGNVDYVLLLNVLHHMIAGKKEKPAFDIVNDLIDRSKTVFCMVRPYWIKKAFVKKGSVVDITGKGREAKWPDVAPALLRKTNATWIKDYGVVPYWYGRPIYAFGKD